MSEQIMKPVQMIFVWLVGTSLLYVVSCASQGCATANVNVRSGPGTSYPSRGVLMKGNCLPYEESSWAQVVFEGSTGWISKRYFSIPTGSSGCPRIITRSEWGARSPKSSTPMRKVPGNVYIHHGTGPSCSTSTACEARVRSYQNYHMNTRGWSDIGYSFIIGEDGNVYEGRGWMKVGAHTSGHNKDGYGFCVIGDFSNSVPNNAALTALQRLIACGVSKGHLQENYVLKGHRDVGSTSCPGTKFYNLIKTWPHYKNPSG